jgi:hypothetical protein
VTFYLHLLLVTIPALVDANWSSYFQTPSSPTKRAIVADIVRTIHSQGKFLNNEQHVWRELSREESCRRVTRAMQQYRRQQLLGSRLNSDVASPRGAETELCRRWGHSTPEGRSKKPARVTLVRPIPTNLAVNVGLFPEHNTLPFYPSYCHGVSCGSALPRTGGNTYTTPDCHLGISTVHQPFHFPETRDMLTIGAALPSPAPLESSIDSVGMSLWQILALPHQCSEPADDVVPDIPPLCAPSLLRMTSDFTLGDFSVSSSSEARMHHHTNTFHQDNNW